MGRARTVVRAGTGEDPAAVSPGFALALGALGLLIGLLVGTTSIGGVLLVPALVLVATGVLMAARVLDGWRGA